MLKRMLLHKFLVLSSNLKIFHHKKNRYKILTIVL